MRIYLVCLVFLLTKTVSAQTANMVLQQTYQRFAQVKNFSGKVHIDFDLPSINIDKMDGKVYYKAPDKFRVKLTGIAFLPKQDPFYVVKLLRDSTSYMAVFNGTETIKGSPCKIVSVIPHNDPELVMAKLWIDTKAQIVMQSETTTKSSGTGKAEYTYGQYKAQALPDAMLFTVDMATFKIPKMVAIDINSRKKDTKTTPRGTGTIAFQFSEYVLNKGIDETVFKQKP